MASPSTSAEPQTEATNPSNSSLYSKLSTLNSIRLLRIEPSTGPDLDEDVKCTLAEHSFSSPPTYNALSYTWNSPSTETAALDAGKPTHCRITINSHPVLVTRNLFDFLISFRNSKHENKGAQDQNPPELQELIWIDAVCINQSDTLEKTHQVRLMTQIYRQASTVYVWLGRILPDEDAKKTLDLLATVWVTCQAQDSELNPDGTRTEKIVTKKIAAWDTNLYAPQPMGPLIPWDDRQMILAFLRKTWFSRIWIVQAVVVAREVVMLWGHLKVGWELVVDVVSDIETTAFGDYIKAAGEEDCQAVRGCGNSLEHYHETPQRMELGNPVMIQSLRERYLAGKTILLGEALTSTWKFYATDKRDFSFALLGIVQLKKGDDAADDLVVDYSLSAEAVFEQATRYLWNVEKSYGQILDVVVPDEETLASRTSPSWLLDFSVRRRPPLAFWATPQGDYVEIPVNMTGYEPPSPPGNWQSDTTGEAPKLRITAAYVDEVVACGEPINQWRTKTGFLKSLEIIRAMPGTYLRQNKLEAFWRTLICNIWPDGPVVPAPEEAAASFKNWLLCSHYAYFISVLVENAPPPGPRPSYTMAWLQDPTHDVIPDPFQFVAIPHPRSPTTHGIQPGATFHHAVQYFEDMKLFLTKKGALGLGPATLRPGDTIWGWEYSRWLYAMRDVPGADSDGPETTKQFVGATYVHGMTEGKWLRFVMDAKKEGDSWKVVEPIQRTVINLV